MNGLLVFVASSTSRNSKDDESAALTALRGDGEDVIPKENVMIGRSMIQRICKRTFSTAALLAMLAAIGVTSLPAKTEAQTLLQTNARYPRVRLLPSGELIATVLLFPNDYRVKVFSSFDNGASWTAVGMVSEPNFPTARTSSPDF